MTAPSNRNAVLAIGYHAVMKKLIRDLRSILPRERILTDTGEVELYDSDGLMLKRGHASGVVVLRSRSEVVEVMRLFAREKIPFVPRGAGLSHK
ncbi:MAG: hypothetical protein AAF488_03360 [Planctomycetota bacterium]